MYLLDSNILIYYLEGQKEIGVFVDSVKSVAFVSVISVTELLAKPKLTKEQITLIEDFLDEFTVLDVGENIAKEAASLKRKYNLTFPDALLAATAKTFDLSLVSKDKIFSRISELKLIN